MTARGARLSIVALLVTVSAISPAMATDIFKPSQAEHNGMLRELDQVFDWAGVQRLSDLQQLSCGEYSDGYAACSSKLSLRVDGTARPYYVEFDGKRHKLGLASFYPDEPTSPEVKKQGFYTPDQNTIKDPKQRAFA